MRELIYLKDRHKQYMAGLAQDQYGTARTDLGLAVKEIERLSDALEQAQSDVLHWKGMTKGRESEIDKHLARIEQLEEAILNFVTQYAECKPHIDNAFFMTYELRGGKYDGPNYAEELKALRKFAGDSDNNG